MRLKFGAVLATACTLVGLNGGPAAAAPAGPRSLEREDVKAWIDKNLDAKDWHYVLSSHSAAFLAKAEPVPMGDWPITRGWFRAEAFPGSNLTGSRLFYWEMDCAHHRAKTLSWTEYPEANLKGRAKAGGSKAEARWGYPLPGDIDRELLNFTCILAQMEKAG